MDIINGVDKRLNTICNGLGFANSSTSYGQEDISALPEQCCPEVPVYGNGKYTVFVYAEDDCADQKIWQVPRLFTFPKVNRFEGWKFWILGMPDHRERHK